MPTKGLVGNKVIVLYVSRKIEREGILNPISPTKKKQKKGFVGNKESRYFEKD